MVIKSLLTLFCAQMAVSKSVPDPSISPVILYGTPARIDDFPFFAGLEYCGASILSKRWLLTAAHCVEEPIPIADRYVFVGGERKDNSAVLKYGKIVIHPHYHQKLLFNDIALLRLQTPLKFSQKVKPVKLQATQIPDIKGNQSFVLIGRGTDETNELSASLMKMDVTTLSVGECFMASFGVHTEPFSLKTLICGTKSDGRGGMCFGDSGSPLLHGDTIVGLASFIPNPDCHRASVGFYTNVTAYLPWIRSVIGSK